MVYRRLCHPEGPQFAPGGRQRLLDQPSFPSDSLDSVFQMLAALTVRDIVLIEQAALEFAPGLNVLTGETGAGKSILLDSLGLAIGTRGRAGVRPGAAQGSATAIFDPAPGHASRALLTEQPCRRKARSCCAAAWPPTANPAPSSMTRRWALAC